MASVAVSSAMTCRARSCSTRIARRRPTARASAGGWPSWRPGAGTTCIPSTSRRITGSGRSCRTVETPKQYDLTGVHGAEVFRDLPEGLKLRMVDGAIVEIVANAHDGAVLIVRTLEN